MTKEQEEGNNSVVPDVSGTDHVDSKEQEGSNLTEVLTEEVS